MWPWRRRPRADVVADTLAEVRELAERVRDLAESHAATDWLLRRELRRRFVVTTDVGTFDGLLDEVDDRVMVLVDAGALNDKGARRPIDGRLYLERDRIAYMQAP